MKAGRCFISEFSNSYFLHGGIGIVDAESILKREGYVPIVQPFGNSFSLRAKVSRLLFSFKILITIDRNAVVVFIHPLYARLDRWLIQKLARKTKRVICFIGDIDGLKDANQSLLQKEIEFLQNFRYFILHNQSMASWFAQFLPGKSIELIQFFDFLAKPMDAMRTNSGPIVFAGNLDKSRFLEKLEGLALRFSVYGPGATEAMLKQECIEYHGVIDPYELPRKLKGSYGLVWDGNSPKEMEGSIGNYMQYVSHHKLSLYILAGLPIIIYQSAGAASLVMEYGIGFCITKLDEIRPRINSISASQYQQMINNMKPLAERIASGKCLANALEKTLERMD